MKLWERFLRIIYRTAAKPFLKKYKVKSLESVLLKSLNLLDVSVLEEIKIHVFKSFTPEGGFADRGGKSDLYYSLFGCFVAEALSINEITPQLKEFVNEKVKDPALSGINLYCCAILYSKLNRIDSTTERLRQRVEVELMNNNNSEYFFFIGLLTLYYLQDYRLILKLKNRIKSSSFEKDIPCSLTAADSVICKALRKPVNEIEIKLKSFYRDKGGFVALQKAPIEDLLSTAVALYALSFIDADITEIKPDCLSFVDGLYLNGGFCATELDFDIDIEYTFYGLLALGALAEQK